MSARAYTAFYNEPFSLSPAEWEWIAPGIQMVDAASIEWVAPDVAVAVAIELFADPAIITVDGSGTTFEPASPVPRVRVDFVGAENNEQWFSDLYVPLQGTDIDNPFLSRPGDVLLAFIASREVLTPPSGFALQAQYQIDLGDDGFLWLGAFTRRLQVAEMPYTWPGAYSHTYVSSGWAAYSLYNISGAIDPDDMIVVFEEFLGQDSITAPVATGEGEIGFVVLASTPGTPNLHPDEFDYFVDATEFSLEGQGFIGSARPRLFLGFVGAPDATWESAGPMALAISASVMLAASGRLHDDGAEAPVGVRSPIMSFVDPPPSPVSLEFDFLGDNDGAFYFIGTDNLTSSWTNPITSGEVVATTLTQFPDAGYYPFRSVDRGESYLPWHSDSSVGNWITYDLGPRSLQPTRYTIRGREDYYGTFMRSWVVEASNDGVSWDELDAQSDVSTVDFATWAGFEVEASEPYRYLRLRSTGPDSDLGDFLVFSEIEFYGELYF